MSFVTDNGKEPIWKLMTIKIENKVFFSKTLVCNDFDFKTLIFFVMMSRENSF